MKEVYYKKMKRSGIFKIIVNLKNDYIFYVEKATTGQSTNKGEDISYWREVLYTKFITYLLPTCLIALIPGVYMAFKSNLFFVAYSDLFAVVSIATISLNKKLSIGFRKAFVMGIFYFLSIALLVDLSLLGPGIVYLLALSILITIFYSSYWGYMSVVANFLICICCALIIHFKLFNSPLVRDYELGAWIAVSSNLIFLSFVIVVLISNTIKSLEKVIRKEVLVKNDLEKEVERGIKSNLLLKESESHFKSLFFQNPSPMYVLDSESLNFLLVNDAACLQYGYSSEEFLLMNLIDIKSGADIKVVNADLQKNKILGVPVIIYSKHYKKNKEIFNAEIVFSSFLFNGIDATIAISKDITESKQAEEALIDSEANLQTIFENTSEGFILLDINGIVKIFNTKTAKTILLNTGLVIKVGSSIYDFIHPSRKDKYKDVLAKVLSGKSFKFDYSFKRDNGETKWYVFCVNPAYNKEGAIEGVCITTTDITQKKKAELKLYESEIFNKGILSSLNSHIAVVDNNGSIIAVNKSWNDFAKGNGMTSLERVSEGSNYFEVCNKAAKNGDKDAAQALSGIQSVLNEESQYFEMEYPCHSPNEERWFTLGVKSFGSDTHKVVISHQDISILKKTEQLIQQYQSNLKAIIENTDALIYSLDTEFRYIAFNQILHDELFKVYGINVKIGDHAFEFLEKLDQEEANSWLEIYKKVLKGETVKFELRGTKVKTEQELTAGDFHNYSSFSIYPIWENNTIIGLSCFIYDITKQKESQKKNEKLSADLLLRNQDLEQFAFIISHNLRAPAANIIGYTEYLQDETLSPQEQKESLEALSLSVKGLDAIIKDINTILQIKREDHDKKESVVFSKIVNDIRLSIQNLIERHNVSILTDFSEVDQIYSLKVYIYSIFYNLIENSIKYSKPDEPAVIEIKSKIENGKICLIFKDNGVGINLNTHGDKVFGLYKRFLPQIEGRGIGLFMVKAQVESLGGSITISSELNIGTQFKIIFYN